MLSRIRSAACTVLPAAKADRKTVPKADVSRISWIGPQGAIALLYCLLQDGGCRRLVGDQAVDQTSLQRRRYRCDLGRTDGCPDGQGFGRDLRGNAGQAVVDAAVDDAALSVECPTGQLADGAQAHHFEQLLTRDEAINVHLRALVHLADPDQPQVGPGCDRS